MIITDQFVVLNLPKTGSTFVRTVLKELHMTQMKRRSLLTKFLNKCGITRPPTFQELGCPNIKVRRGSKKDQHGTYQQIPSPHKRKKIMSVVRNPYDRLLSAYEFRWWAKFPPVGARLLMSKFPHFPDLSLDDYVELQNIDLNENRIPHIQMKADVGSQTVQFIQMFFRNPEEVLMVLDEEYIRSDQFIRDMPDITFLRTESLNQDIYDFVLDQGYNADDLAFILNHESVNVTKGRSNDRNTLWTEMSLRHVQQRERLLFKILNHHGMMHPAPPAACT